MWEAQGNNATITKHCIFSTDFLLYELTTHDFSIAAAEQLLDTNRTTIVDAQPSQHIRKKIALFRVQRIMAQSICAILTKKNSIFPAPILRKSIFPFANLSIRMAVAGGLRPRAQNNLWFSLDSYSLPKMGRNQSISSYHASEITKIGLCFCNTASRNDSWVRVRPTKKWACTCF